MKYIYLVRADNHFDQNGKLRTLYGIDVWRLPDRDARLCTSYPALFSDRRRAEALVERVRREHLSPDQLPKIIEAAREQRSL